MFNINQKWFSPHQFTTTNWLTFAPKNMNTAENMNTIYGCNMLSNPMIKLVEVQFE